MTIKELGGNQYQATCSDCGRSVNLDLNEIDIISEDDFDLVEEEARKKGFIINEEASLFTPSQYMEDEEGGEDYEFILAILDHVANYKSGALKQHILESINQGEVGAYLKKTKNNKTVEEIKQCASLIISEMKAGKSIEDARITATKAHGLAIMERAFDSIIKACEGF